MRQRRVLHTAVGDEIRKIAETDPERAAEMKMESMEYRDEVMGRLDYDEEILEPGDYGYDGPPPNEDDDWPEDC